MSLYLIKSHLGYTIYGLNFRCCGHEEMCHPHKIVFPLLKINIVFARSSFTISKREITQNFSTVSNPCFKTLLLKKN